MVLNRKNMQFNEKIQNYAISKFIIYRKKKKKSLALALLFKQIISFGLF